MRLSLQLSPEDAVGDIGPRTPAFFIIARFFLAILVSPNWDCFMIVRWLQLSRNSIARGRLTRESARPQPRGRTGRNSACDPVIIAMNVKKSGGRDASHASARHTCIGHIDRSVEVIVPRGRSRRLTHSRDVHPQLTLFRPFEFRNNGSYPPFRDGILSACYRWPP